MPVVVDPALQESLGEREISIDERDRPVLEILESVALTAGLDYDILRGVVLLSTPERLYGSYSQRSLTLDGQQLSSQAAEALAAPVVFDYYMRTPLEILQDTAERSGIPITVDPRSALARGGPVMARFEKVSVRNVAALLALAYGDDAAWTGTELRVGPPESVRNLIGR